MSASMNFARDLRYVSALVSLFVCFGLTRKVILCSCQNTAEVYIEKAGVFKAANVYSDQRTIFNWLIVVVFSVLIVVSVTAARSTPCSARRTRQAHSAMLLTTDCSYTKHWLRQTFILIMPYLSSGTVCLQRFRRARLNLVLIDT